MSRTSTAGDLQRVADVLDAADETAAVPGRLAAPVLRALAALVPCEVVSYAEFDVDAATHYVLDDAAGGEVTYRSDVVDDDDFDDFYRHYPSSTFCSYPSRSGDERSVILRSDFYSTREWKQTPMSADALYELMCPLPSIGSRSRRVIFFRNGSYDFTEQDRFALALLRPHLTEMVGRRSTAPALGLTGRQQELMRLVADGRTNAEIATTLHLSPHTVRTHLTNIFERLGVSTRAAAVARVFS